jgi:hypothetical protein
MLFHRIKEIKLLHLVDMTLLNFDANSSITIPVKLSLSKIVTLFFYACFMVNHVYASDRDLQQLHTAELTELVVLSTLSPSSLSPLVKQSHHLAIRSNQYKQISLAIDALLAQGHLSQQREYQLQQSVYWHSRHRLQLAFTSHPHILNRHFVTHSENTPPKQ